MLWLLSVLESTRKSHKTRNLSSSCYMTLCALANFVCIPDCLLDASVLTQRNIVLASGVESAPFGFANASSQSRSSSPRRAIHASGPSRSPCDSFRLSIGHGSFYSSPQNAFVQGEATPQRSAPSSAGPHRSRWGGSSPLTFPYCPVFLSSHERL